MSSVETVLESFRSDPHFRNNITFWHTIPAQSAVFGHWPEAFSDKIREVLAQRGIQRLYSHQAESIEHALKGENVIVVTPTASGKTMCYNLPVLHHLSTVNAEARALYLFPTKALSQDQLLELHDLSSGLGQDLKVHTFDGDTPQSARRSIRNSGHIVVTNPDMLHTGILPHHTLWIRLFENLKFVVIDEVHHYRGVFGSHMANLMRRLRRICRFYGSDPQFICCSATIANPKELAEKLIGRLFTLVDENGAPRGEKHFLFYNPPVVNQELGIRKSVINEAGRIATSFLLKEVQTIVFGRSRLRVEILSTYLKRAMSRNKKDPDRIRAYRGGYLPNERRDIEEGTRTGRYLGVVSTNALELGIDIGRLKAAVLAGYPGTIASTWQQGGRAGRSQEASVIVLVASSAPLDQFIIQHPRYFFATTPECGLINPDNLAIMVSHLKCGAFELPLNEGEHFGEGEVDGILRYLEEERVLRHSGEKWFWSSAAYPAEEISLRSASSENFVIINTSDNNNVLGEVDLHSAPMLIHEQAIYLHQSRQFVIDKLDWDGRTAYAREVDVDYYTDSVEESDIKVLTADMSDSIETEQGDHVACAYRYFGEVAVSTIVPKYKKIRFETHENVGFGNIHLPQLDKQTEAYWMEISEELLAKLAVSEIDMGGGLHALATAICNVVPVFVLCDPRDICAAPMVRAPFSGLPTIYLYDVYPGGIGIARRIYDIDQQIFAAADELIRGCSCRNGCPSCVGPALEIGDRGKESALILLKKLK
ncbi:MAG: DEAD/DEAH box helicase [Candidatus Omnitrophota bacterium]|jgi:DEAD/DEAH box helicase domain-containing protein|nr:MAG: DEAD/DEAH box helicase [Candidatus Omnitrophota bacterium]